ncbi:uncharacterized protein LOC118319457 isoform X2 [Scophthalmus maximus]|uniref:uncharacterized protein LOC118319457 isoform X2 n=1 Tax=Scophthalmus maximus TaxID=52904 RepID=UPI001FA87323|nr:uncharacterized protein LOC118319457 isoform X2 [Scophthalmus maximus]
MYCYILDDSTTPAYARAIFMRLDKIEQSLETIKSILTRDMRSDDPEIEVFSRPLKTPAELEAFRKINGQISQKESEACSKSYPKITLKTVETCIADTLRYAPHRGTRGESNHRKEGERGADMQHMVGIGVEPWTAAGGLQPPVGCRCFNDHNYIVDEAGPSMAESNVAATEGSRSPSLFSESADSE